MHLHIINRVFKLYYRLDSDAEINEGWCMRWAYTAYCLYGGTLCAAGKDYHAFLKLDGKYYDSECLQGTSDWRNLNCLQGVDFGYQEFEEDKNFFDHWEFEPHQKVLDNVRALVRRAA